MRRSPTAMKRLRWGAAVAMLFALALVAILGSAGTSPRHERLSLAAANVASPPAAARRVDDALDPRVGRLAGEHPHQLIEAIVQFKPGVRLGTAYRDARRARARVLGGLSIIHGFALRVGAGQAVHLARNPDVHSLSLNTRVMVQHVAGTVEPSQLQTTFNQSLDSPAVWRIGGTGAHVGVAVIDTGIDGQLPDFRSATSGQSREVASAVTNPATGSAVDTYGHGTDVAGIVAGNGANRDDADPLRAHYAGVAPDASLISIKVSDDSGNATVLNAIYGLQFAVDFRDRYNIRVVNLSLDSTAAQSYQTDPLDAAVEAAWRHGIVVVAAAGNRGLAPDAVDYAPANDPFVITVGAVDEQGSPNPADHTTAQWSSRGMTQDGVAKPDVYAPGAHIVSVLAPASVFASACPACIVNGEYIRVSGTSLAAPMVSGLVADVLELHPTWTPDQVKGALLDSTVRSDELPEIDALKVAGLRSPTVANQNLTPSALLAASSGETDYSKSSWNKSSWNVATGPLSADFAKSSWNCNCSASTGEMNPTKSSWGTATWSTQLFENQG